VSFHCIHCGRMRAGSGEACNGEWFKIWCPDFGQIEEDAKVVCATEATAAVTDWAELSDRQSADYTIVRGSDVKVYVRRQTFSQVVDVYLVQGETVPRYSANRIGAMGGVTGRSACTCGAARPERVFGEAPHLAGCPEGVSR